MEKHDIDKIINKNFIVIGDSIIYGIGDFQNGGWPEMFKNYVVNKDDSKVCTNYVHIAGFPGATSTDILNKIDSIIKSFRHDDFDNVIILSIGVNDTQEFNGKEKNSIEKYKENMVNIAKHIINRNCNLIVLGLTRIECDKKFLWKPNKYYDNSIISEYDRDLELILNYDTELKKLCQERRINYIPMKDVLRKEDFIDGLHPTTEGHRKMCDYIIDEIIKVI